MLYNSEVWFFVAPVGWAIYDLFAVYVRKRMPSGSIKPWMPFTIGTHLCKVFFNALRKQQLISITHCIHLFGDATEMLNKLCYTFWQ